VEEELLNRLMRHVPGPLGRLSTCLYLLLLLLLELLLLDLVDTEIPLEHLWRDHQLEVLLDLFVGLLLLA
jgi:hypothetical protein